MMTVIPGLATAASRATAAADRDPHSASRGPAVVKANAFLTVDGDHVRVAEDGGIVYDRDAEGSFTVSARSGWRVEGRETLTIPYSAERPRTLKMTGLTGEDEAEVPVEPDDEEEPEEEEDYTLSIECDRYLGLDRTDSGRLGHTVKTATATLDPECEGATVTWISCGSLCEFVEGDRVVTKPTGWTVSYRNKDPDTPSTEVDAEELVAEVTIPGKDGTIRASKRFTVVKVDACLWDVEELKDEKCILRLDSYVERDGSGFQRGYPVSAVKAMEKGELEVDIRPFGLPRNELVSLDFCERELILGAARNPDVANPVYALNDFLDLDFFAFGNGETGKKAVKVVHCPASATDMVTYEVSCCVVTLSVDFSRNNSMTPVSKEGEFSEPGHAFWRIDVDEAHKILLPAYLQDLVGVEMGYYPDGTGLWDVPGILQNEMDLGGSHVYRVQDGLAGSATHTWHISFEDCRRGLLEADSFRANPTTYDLFRPWKGYNCVTAALAVVLACGVDVKGMGLDSLTPAGLVVDMKVLNVVYGEKE